MKRPAEKITPEKTSLHVQNLSKAEPPMRFQGCSKHIAPQWAFGHHYHPREEDVERTQFI